MFASLYQPNYIQICKLNNKTIDKIKIKEYHSINTQLHNYTQRVKNDC